MRDLVKTHELNLLFDLYGVLLTDKQKEYFTMYLMEDLTLREIASRFLVSHSAVYDAISTIINVLNNYEQKLKLLSKKQQREKLYDAYKNSNTKELINQLEAID